MSARTLWEVREALGKDDRGIIRGVRVNTWHWTGAVHCLNAWGWWPLDDKVVVGDWAFCRKLGTESDPVVTELPPVGTQVYQITPKGELRTSRIRRYIPTVAQSEVLPVGALLHPAGPFAGVPVGGDSGSICFVRQADEWRVLGVVSYASRVELSRPITSGTWAVKPLLIPPGVALSNDASDAVVFAPWRLEGEMGFPAPTNREPAVGVIPVLSLPQETADVVGAFQAAPDGVPDVLVQVASPYPVEDLARIEVSGNGDDLWVWPSNGSNWDLWRHDGADDRLVLRFNRSQKTNVYVVTLRSKSGQSSEWHLSPMVFTKPPAVEPEKSDPATPDAGASIVVEKLRRELEDERKRADRLADDVKRLEDQLKLYHDENASLRDTLANERTAAAGLRLGLEMLGKEMGWAP